MNTDDKQQGVQALETGLGILEALVSAPGWSMLRDIAISAEVHPAKAHRYLVSFIRRGYVEQDASGLYRLGPNALRVGLSCLAQLDAVRMVTPLLEQLCKQIDESVMAAVWGSVGPTVVQWRDAARPVNVNVRPGSVLPLLTSATGRVFCTYFDYSIVDPLIEQELAEKKKADNWNFPAYLSEVEQMRAQVRLTGIGTICGELRRGINGVSAPVFNHEGKLVLAVTALGNDHTFDVDKDGPVAAAVRATAAALSHELGHDMMRD